MNGNSSVFNNCATNPGGMKSIIGAVASLALIATSGSAQVISIPHRNPAVMTALAAIKADNAWTLDQQKSICEIPAPPFKEAVRAAEYKRRFESLGYRNVRIDSEGNVIAERPGTGNGPTVLIMAHLDTVFPEGTDVSVSRAGTLMKGPAIRWLVPLSWMGLNPEMNWR